jgi:hypothetical protein
MATGCPGDQRPAHRASDLTVDHVVPLAAGGAPFAGRQLAFAELLERLDPRRFEQIRDQAIDGLVTAGANVNSRVSRFTVVACEMILLAMPSQGPPCTNRVMLDGLRPGVATRPILVLNPRIDRRFTEAASEIVEAGVRSPVELERQLRERWPRAVVRPRGLSGEQPTMWYVYRDGRWTPDEALRRRREQFRHDA